MTHESSLNTEAERFNYRALLLWLLAAGIMVYLLYPHRDPFLEFADKTFMLSRRDHDVRMIVIFSLSFLVLWRALDALLFSPCLRLLAERESATSGAVMLAAETMGRAEITEAEFAEQMLLARSEAARKKLVRLTTVTQETTALVSRAQVEGQAALRSARGEIAADGEELRRRLTQEIDVLAARMVDQVRRPPRFSSPAAAPQERP